ncbi:hypothetical protein [Pseudovibrio ascidiaceicola]|uniref:hypothetical protein n=1 Tax=Pseudovibrio ascidiaceicola TaxID=285279 RepID=UPI001356AE97|nr:hypothetical protein [Pseudovibrio ascidiaceicola]
MWKWPVLFWFAVVASVYWLGPVFVDHVVIETYSPMKARGDKLFYLRQTAVIIPILAGVVMFAIWLWRRPLAPLIYKSGLLVLALVALSPFLPRIETDFQQIYWIGQARYEIPWQYAPSKGSIRPGGGHFEVRVSIPDMTPQYESKQKTLAIGKASYFQTSYNLPGPAELCKPFFGKLHCQWLRGDVVYSATGHKDLFPDDLGSLMTSAKELLDSFQVSTSQE